MSPEQGDLIEDFLDITRDVCPMTFVRTKLRLERMAAGAILAVRLKGSEPLANVPRAAEEIGHRIVSLTDEGEGVHTLRIERAPDRTSG